MPTYTNDREDGSPVELLSLDEWLNKNNKAQPAATDFSSYVGYALAQVGRARDVDQGLAESYYNGAFKAAVNRGVFSGTPDKIQEEYSQFTQSKPYDEAADYNLLADYYAAQNDAAAAEAAAELGGYVTARRAGQQDAALEEKLQTAKESFASADARQQARIAYAKEQGLSFVTYETADGETDVWVNPKATLSRSKIYEDAISRPDLIDPRYAEVAYKYTLPSNGSGVPLYRQRQLAEVAELKNNVVKAGSAGVGEFAAAARAYEQGKQFMDERIAQAPVTTAEEVKKSLGQQVLDNIDWLAIGFGEGLSPERKRYVADGEAYGSAKQQAEAFYTALPDNHPLKTDYEKDDVVTAVQDDYMLSAQTGTDYEKPENNFVTLSTGMRAPLAGAAFLDRAALDAAYEKLELSEDEQAAANAARTAMLGGAADQIFEALDYIDGNKFRDFVAKYTEENATAGMAPDRGKLIEEYIEQSKGESFRSLKAKSLGIYNSVVSSVSDMVSLAQYAGAAGMGALGGDWAEASKPVKEAALGSIITGTQRARGIRQVASLYGGEPGLAYEALATAAPVLTDIVIAGGAGGLARRGAMGAASALFKSEALTGTRATVRRAAINWIDDALSNETRGIVGNYFRNVAARTGDTNINRVFTQVSNDFKNKLIEYSAVAPAIAAQRATSFTRSALGTWSNQMIDLPNIKNPDGSRKYSDEQVRQMAFTGAMVAGSITALVEQSFGKFLGEGADITGFGKYGIRQLKAYSDDIASAFRSSGYAGKELYDTLRTVSREALREGYGQALKQIPAEALEEGVDELASSVALAMINDHELNLKDAFSGALQAAAIGGIFGVAFGTTAQLRGIRFGQDIETGTKQEIQYDLMRRSIDRLKESGSSPRTVEVLENRLRRAVRTGEVIERVVTPQSMRNWLTDRLEQVPAAPPVERPDVVPVPPSTDEAPTATPTAKAAKLIQEYKLSAGDIAQIKPTGKGNTITPNDVDTYLAQRVAEQKVRQPVPPAEPVPATEQSFRQLAGRIAIVDGFRGRVVVEDTGVVLDPEDGTPPLELTPNPDMVAGSFEGFSAPGEPTGKVSPKRVQRLVESVDDEAVYYGKTRYEIPAEPVLSNLQVDDKGSVDIVTLRVYNESGQPTTVHLTAADAAAVRAVYEARGPEALAKFDRAMATAQNQEVQRNVASRNAKRQASRKRRASKVAKNAATPINDQQQQTIEDAGNEPLQPNGTEENAALKATLREVATLLGVPEDLGLSLNEMLEMFGSEAASGFDFQSVDPAILNAAVQKITNGVQPSTVLEHMIAAETATARITNPRTVAKLVELLRAHKRNDQRAGFRAGENDPVALLRSITKTAENPDHRAAAQRLLARGLPQGLRVVVVKMPNTIGTAGAYLAESNAIILNAASDNGGGLVDALIHELTHATLDDIVVNPRNDAERAAVEEIRALRAELSAKAAARYGDSLPGILRYGLDGTLRADEPVDDVYATREFIAHMKASKPFRDALDKLLEAEGAEAKASFWGKLFSAIAKAFGYRAKTAESNRLAKAFFDLDAAVEATNSTAPYGTTINDAIVQRSVMTPAAMAATPNPYARNEFAWVEYEVASTAPQPLTVEEIKDVISRGTFGMLTGENPNAVADTDENNARAERWLRDRGYTPLSIVGRYNENGERSFLVPNLTTADAIAFANEFGRESVALNTGLIYRDGSYNPRTDEVFSEYEPDDDFFSATRASDGTVVTIRVGYDFDTVVDPEPAEVDHTAGFVTAGLPQEVAVRVAGLGAAPSSARDATVWAVDKQVFVNSKALATELENYAAEDQPNTAERLVAVARASALATNPVVESSLEDLGLNSQIAGRHIAMGSSPTIVADLARTSGGREFAYSYYQQLAVSNNGNNPLMEVAVANAAETYRALYNGVNASEETPFDPAIPAQLRGADVVPVIQYSKALLSEAEIEVVKGQVVRGRTVGTRNPTSKVRTETGSNPALLVDLDTLKQSPVQYRKNVLVLAEYPLIAGEFPELVALYNKSLGNVPKLEEQISKLEQEIKASENTLRAILFIEKDRFGITTKTAQKVDRSDVDKALAAASESVAAGVALPKYFETTGRNRTLADVYKKSTRNRAKVAELTSKLAAAKSARTKYVNELVKRDTGYLAENADRIVDVFAQRIVENLEVSFEMFPSVLRDNAKLWYDGANKIAQNIAKRDGLTLEQASAVLAVFSPQKIWTMNVAIAERTTDIYRRATAENLVWTAEHTRRFLMRAGEPDIVIDDGGNEKYPKGVEPVWADEANKIPAYDPETGRRLFKGWSYKQVEAKLKTAENALAAAGLLEHNVGFNDFKDATYYSEEKKGNRVADATAQKAWFIRMEDELRNPRVYPNIRPDGTYGGNDTNENGKELSLAWGAYNTIEKAVRVIESLPKEDVNSPTETQFNDMLEVINNELGNAHKVRSFYNNIVDPASPDNHVTMDTHAIAVALWLPLAGGSREVTQNFGGSSGAASSEDTGIGGLYPIFAEAYKRAAVELSAKHGKGYLPREIQSITWEAVRLLFKPKWKGNSKNVNAVRALWADYAAGRTSIEDTRAKVYELATTDDKGKFRTLADALGAANDDPAVGLGYTSWAEIETGPAPAISYSRTVLTAPAESTNEVRAYVTAKFAGIAKKLGTELVPNISGYTVRYVVGDARGGNYIEYNPREFVGEDLNAVDAIFREELIHAACGQVLRNRKEDWVQFNNSIAAVLTKDERKMVKSVYKSLRNDTDYGAEYFRMGVQKLVYGTITEAERKTSAIQKIVALLKDVVEFFTGQRVDPLVREVFDDTVRAVRAADPQFKKELKVAKPKTGKPKIQRSRALFAAASPDVESAYAAATGDLFFDANGEWNGTLLGSELAAKLLRSGGTLDPRMNEALLYQQRAARLAALRTENLVKRFKKAIEEEGLAVDYDDINAALGSNAPTVPAALRKAAQDRYDAAVAAADAVYAQTDQQAKYRADLKRLKNDYKIHLDKDRFASEVDQLKKHYNNPTSNADLAARNAAYDAAQQQYNVEIQQARAANVLQLRQLQAAAIQRLENTVPQFAELVVEMRKAIDDLSTQLRDELDLANPVRMVIDANLGIYLVRSYRIHHDEEYAAAVLDPNNPTYASERETARRYFEKQYIRDTYAKWRRDAKYTFHTDAEVMDLVVIDAQATDAGKKLLHKYLEEHNGNPDIKSLTAQRTDLTRFMVKDEVPAELRALLGEDVNPVENAINTYGAVARFLGTQQLLNRWAEIGQNGGWLVTAADVAADPDKYHGYQQLTKTTRTRGGEPLSNFYAPPEIKEVFDNMFDPAPKTRKGPLATVDRALSKAVGASMGVTTLASLGFYIRNVTSIPLFMGMNGFVPSVENLVLARKTVLNLYSGNLEGLAADAVALGLAKSTMSTGLIRDALAGIAESPEGYFAQIQQQAASLTNPQSKFGKAIAKHSERGAKVVDAIWEGTKTIGQRAADLAESIDFAYRMTAWAYEYDVLVRANSQRATPLTEAQMKQEAARIVVETSQGRDRAMPFFAEFNASGLGTVFNSFFRFTGEIFRLPVAITRQGLREIKSESAVIRQRGAQRLAGLGGSLALAVFLPVIFRAVSGLGDDEEEAVRKGLPEYQKDSNLYITRDENGDIVVWDLTYVIPYSIITDPLARSLNHMINGRVEEVPGTMLSWASKTFLTPQIATDAAFQLLYNQDEAGRPIWLESDGIGESILKGLNHLRREAYRFKTPEAIMQAMKAYMSNGVYDTGEQVKKAGEILWDQIKPARPARYPISRLARRSFGKVQRLQADALADFKRRMRSREVLTSDDVGAAYADYTAALQFTARDYTQIIRGFRALGMADSAIRQQAVDVGFSKRRFDLANRGVFERYTPAPELLRDFNDASKQNRAELLAPYIQRLPRYNPIQ